MKRTVLWMLIGAMVFTLFACTGPENQTVKIKPLVVMVSDTGGLGDQGQNDVAWAGCEKISKEKEVDIRCLESKSKEDYTKNIETAIQEDAAVVICVGADLTDATKAMAAEYPKTKFILVDGKVDMDNVTCIEFQQQEGAFLAGVAAARTSTTGKIGFIGGVESPAMEKYQYGFAAGVRTINPQAEVSIDYTGNLDREDEAAALAKKQRDGGVDVIFQSAGRGGLGIIDLAEKENFWVIGSERDQSGFSSKHVLCSVVKDGDAAVYEEVEKALKGNQTKGTVSHNLKDKYVYLSDNAGNLNGETKKEIERWKEAIVKGDVTVPYSETSAAEYVPAEI